MTFEVENKMNVTGDLTCRKIIDVFSLSQPGL